MRGQKLPPRPAPRGRARARRPAIGGLSSCLAATLRGPGQLRRAVGGDRAQPARHSVCQRQALPGLAHRLGPRNRPPGALRPAAGGGRTRLVHAILPAGVRFGVLVAHQLEVDRLTLERDQEMRETGIRDAPYRTPGRAPLKKPRLKARHLPLAPPPEPGRPPDDTFLKQTPEDSTLRDCSKATGGDAPARSRAGCCRASGSCACSSARSGAGFVSGAAPRMVLKTGIEGCVVRCPTVRGARIGGRASMLGWENARGAVSISLDEG